MLTFACRPVKPSPDCSTVFCRCQERDAGPPVDDQVTAAVNRVARDRYLCTADGRQLPQTPGRSGSP
jgi:hypothetical protein